MAPRGLYDDTREGAERQQRQCAVRQKAVGERRGRGSGPRRSALEPAREGARAGAAQDPDERLTGPLRGTFRPARSSGPAWLIWKWERRIPRSETRRVLPK